MSRRKFLCLTCKQDTGRMGEHYMLRDEVWAQVHDSPVGMLCVLCCEARLGRELVPGDFNDSWVNRPKFQSDRLASRLGLT